MVGLVACQQWTVDGNDTERRQTYFIARTARRVW